MKTVFAAITIFVAAATVFAIEPMAAKALQPSLGGVPSVWTTCLLFFQLALLAGYLTQFILVRCKPASLKWAVHAGVFVLPLLVSRFDFTSELAHSASWSSPVTASLWFLLRTVGLPFAALCTVAPSIQRYFTEWTGKSPYGLYAASNAGSAAGLLLYPFVIEPWLPLVSQSMWLRVAYIAVGIAVLAFGLSAMQKSAPVETLHDPPTAEATAEPKGRGAHWWQWVALSAIPSGLLATTSTTIAGDLPGIPLLWVTPLAVYLGTFILGFARGKIAPRWVDRGALLLSIVLVPVTLRRTTSPYGLLLALHLGFLALLSFSAHSKLASLAPNPKHLERYYLWISVGGVIGTLVFAIIPPHLFSDLWESPLTIAVTALVPLLARDPKEQNAEPVTRPRDWIFAIAPALWLAAAATVTKTTHAAPLGWALGLAYVPAVLLCAKSARAPILLATALLGTAIFGAVFERSSTLTLAYGRSFFGTTRVQSPPGLGMHVLVHGTTIHGSERVAARTHCEPRSYYRHDGPVGRIFNARHASFQQGPVFAIGLGAGAIVCYAQPLERWTFVEIDPDVVRVAREPALFSFLSHNALPPDQLKVVVGDGRLVLTQEPAATYSMIVVDAFNSDSVPLHLLTTEAFDRYFAALNRDGWLILHISNHALDLPRVVSAIVRSRGLAARVNEDASEFSARGYVPTWTVIARSEGALSALALGSGWLPLPDPRGLPAFTDDYASIWRALR